jgi:hypothetical protein
MDWKKTFNLGQWAIHGIMAFMAIATLGSMLFALRMNHLQSTEEERALKTNTLVQHLKNDQSFEKIGKYLSWADNTKAQDKIRELSQRIAETEELLDLKADESLRQNLKLFNQLLNTSSGMSSPGDALKVLGNKVNSLADVAKSHKYKNVSIIAERMQERLEQLTPKNVGHSVQVSYLKSDVKRLEQLISSAALNEGEKRALLDRFISMGNEIDLLGSLTNQSKNLKEQTAKASGNLATWSLLAEKKAKDLQGAKFQKQNQLVMMLAGVVAFIAIAWMGLAYLFRWQKNKIGQQVEMEVKGVIEKGIIGDQRFMVDHYSDLTREDIIKLLDDLKVKLNLGSMLHEGLPFAGCMLDSTFKLTWYNQLLQEQFYLSTEEINSDAFNWDFLRDYLNLDEDPVYEAMVNKIAGIYPVKIKQDEMTPMQPYEMYVTPITINREDRVMVFFYPLISAKEAIQEQVNVSRTTIGRFITLWNEDKLDEDELKFLEKDFSNSDLSPLYTELSQVYKRTTAEKDECLHIIRNLEKDRENLENEIMSWEDSEVKKRDIIKQEFRLANELRDTFITSIEKGEALVHINRSIMQQNDDLRTEAMKLQGMNQVTLKKNKETQDILGQLESVKGDYKKLKLELLDVKTRLVSINNSLFGQLPPLDEAQQRLASRYKDELARLDFNVVTLDKKLSQLDVILGRLQMMNDKAPTEQPMLNFQTSQKDHELKEALLEIQKVIGQSETKIVESFKNLHALMRQDLNVTENVQRPADTDDLLLS